MVGMVGCWLADGGWVFVCRFCCCVVVRAGDDGFRLLLLLLCEE